MMVGSRRAWLRACSAGTFLLVLGGAASSGDTETEAPGSFPDPSIQAADGSSDVADASSDASPKDGSSGAGGTSDSGTKEGSAGSGGRAGTGGSGGSTVDSGRFDAGRNDARLDGSGGARIDSSVKSDAGVTGGADDE